MFRYESIESIQRSISDMRPKYRGPSMWFWEDTGLANHRGQAQTREKGLEVWRMVLWKKEAVRLLGSFVEYVAFKNFSWRSELSKRNLESTLLHVERCWKVWPQVLVEAMYTSMGNASNLFMKSLLWSYHQVPFNTSWNPPSGSACFCRCFYSYSGVNANINNWYISSIQFEEDMNKKAAICVENMPVDTHCSVGG